MSNLTDLVEYIQNLSLIDKKELVSEDGKRRTVKDRDGDEVVL